MIEHIKTKDDMIAVLDEYVDTPDDFYCRWDINDSDIYTDEEKEKINSLLDEFALVAEHGGYEGSGEETWVVVKHKNTETYLRIDGSYYSYSGTDWNEDGWYVVHAKEKTITVFEREE